MAVIGAGPSGLTAAKHALEAGFEPTVFEASDALGGQWHTAAAHSGVWPGMRTNTSRAMTAFSDFPAPADHALHPLATQVHAYLGAYADAFGVSGRILFDARVSEVRPGWTVDGEPFDAVVGRLILFHLDDPVSAIRHHLAAVRPGGRVVALDYDVGAVRSVPDEPFTRHLGDLVLAGFRLVGADPTIGACLQDHLIAAGAEDVAGFGIQPYVVKGSPIGPTMVAGVVRTLAPAIVAHGLATDDELDLDTLADRIAVALDAAGCVLVPPTLVGAWGRRP